MKKYLYILLLGLVVFSSCEEESLTTIIDNPEQKEEVEDGYANLAISINMPDLNVSSRAVGPLENPTNNSNWTNWEKYCDGSLLYRVTLFLVKVGTENGIADGTLVAYRNFYSGSFDIKDGTNEYGENGFYEDGSVKTGLNYGIAVKATFLYSKPMHGDIEKLQKGNYRLIAVANYAPIDATNNANLFQSDESAVSYDGLGSVAEDGTSNYNGVGGSFTDIVSTIITNFNEDKGLTEFTTNENSNGASLLNYQLNSGDDRVCKLLPQPLVMVRDITLNNGSNTLEGQLYRTFARIRLDVKNADVEYPIGISNLKFAGTYASKTAYLFNDRLYGGLYDCFATNDVAALDVTSTDAIFPFMDRTNQLLAGKSLTLFDGYILEGKTSTSVTNAFTFKTTYWTDPWSGSATENVQIHGWDTFLDYKVFIRESKSNTYNILKADADTVAIRNAGAGATDKAATTLNPLYLWYIIPRGDLQVDNSQLGFAEGYLMNVGTGKYLQAHDGTNTLKLGDYPSTLYFKINFNGQDEYGTIFCQSSNGNYYYIATKSSQWSKLGATAPSLTSGDDYSYLTFETIPGEPLGAEESDQGSPIEITNNATIEGTTADNVIIRNDFFHYKFECKVTKATEVSVQPVEYTRRIRLNDFSGSEPYISVSGVTTTTGSGQNQSTSYVDGIEYFYFDYYIAADGYLVVTIKYLLESSTSTLPSAATINFGTAGNNQGGPGGGGTTTNVTHSITVSDFVNATTDITIAPKS